MRYLYLFSTLLFFHYSLTAQTVFSLSSNSTFLDQNKKLIIANYIPEDFVYDENIMLEIDNEQYNLLRPPALPEYGTPYKLKKDGEDFTLYFSPLPLLNIRSFEEIETYSDELVPGKFEMSDTTGFTYASYIGVKVRGASSRNYPKKSYQLRMWTDSASYETKDETFFNMRNDDKWLLLAMWNEKVRLNNPFSHDLWLRIHQLYYAEKEAKANSAIRTKYVEVFLDGNYNGVYAFSENMDRKQLALKKTKDGAVRGELYKGKEWGHGLVIFNMEGVPPFDENDLFWDGQEMKYPKDIPADWSMLHDFAYFVDESSDNDFRDKIFQKFHRENAMDYFIFLNLVHANDNTGKNIFLAKYDAGEPYFYAPWDLDGTLGFDYNGDKWNDNYERILSNRFYDRLEALSPDNYLNDLSARWSSLRENVLDNEALKSRIDSLSNYLQTTGAYEREQLSWQEESNLQPEDVDYIKEWIDNRINFLDQYFADLETYTPKPGQMDEQPVSVFYSRGKFRVLFEKALGNSKLEYRLYTVFGQQIDSGEITQFHNEIDASRCSPGIYLIHFYDLNRGVRFSEKVVVAD